MRKERLGRKFYTRPTLVVAKDLLGKYLVSPIRPRPQIGSGANGVKKIVTKKLVGKIVETEAYIGPKDRASHAFLPRRNFALISEKQLKSLFKGKNLNTKEFYKNFLRGGGKITPRCKTEYLEGGHIYIYLCYGMYWQLNITTEKAGRPECVLVRALEPIKWGQKNKKLKIKNKKQILKMKKLASGPGKLCQWLKLDKSFDGEDLTKSKRIWIESGGVKIKKSEISATKRIGIDYAGIWAKKPWRFYIKNNPFISRK